MKYYVSDNCLYKYENGKYKIYTYRVGVSASGDWFEAEEPKKKKVATKEEIDELMFRVDDDAYEDYHTSYNPGFKDSKGRMHTDYIYQDFRSIDGYDTEDGFTTNEIIYRDDYEYYIDSCLDVLIKIDRETKEAFLFTAMCDEDGNVTKEWYAIDISEWDIEGINSFQEVLDLMERDANVAYDRRNETE